MSNLANYSPYNRSFQFMHLQNSAYHLRNKKSIKSRVNTNLSTRPKTVTQSQEQKPSKYTAIFSNRNRYSPSQNCNSSKLNISKSRRQHSFQFKQPHRVIHKNQVYERAKSAKIIHQNMQFVQKLMETDCLIVKKSFTEDNYQRHKKYRSLRRRYQQNGQRNVTPIINLKKLNPALASYRNNHTSSSRHHLQFQTENQQIPLEWLG